MTEKIAVTDKIAVMLVKQHLAGLRGYPTLKEGESQLVRTLQGAALSVQHAEATLETFDDICPTPREIKDTAFNLRPKFEPPQKSNVEKWREQGYTYDADFYKTLSAEMMGKNQWNYDAELWQAIKARFKPDLNRVQYIPNGQLKSWKRQLGFPLNHYEQLDADAWDKDHPIPGSEIQPAQPDAQSVPPPTPWPAGLKPITQEDIDLAVLESRRLKDEELTELAKRELLPPEVKS